ncbi:MAG: hypothetical protein OEZ06_10975 [Myxococcales bacterium]|nr:hypothetical protein [Myxococcales bacterium]
MTHTMNLLGELVEMMGGRHRPSEKLRSRPAQLAVGAALASLAFAAVWGLAAGAGQVSLALQNVYKVPLVVLLSSLVAAPAGLLTLKLWAPGYEGRSMLLSFAVATFSGTLVLAVVSPLLALYFHSSAWAGPMLGVGSVVLALLVAVVVFIRGSLARIPEGVSKAGTLVAALSFMAMQLAVMMQLIALAAPILTDSALFTGGIDQVVVE